MPILRKIQGFIARTNMPTTKFGRLAVNDPRLIADLRRGRCPRASMVRRIERFIASQDVGA